MATALGSTYTSNRDSVIGDSNGNRPSSVKQKKKIVVTTTKKQRGNSKHSPDNTMVEAQLQPKPKSAEKTSKAKQPKLAILSKPLQYESSRNNQQPYLTLGNN